MLKNKKAVLFDLDGTLVDSLWVWKQIDLDFLGERGFETPKELQGIVEGMSFTEVAVYFKERFQLKESVEEIKKIWQDMAMERYCHSIQTKPGVKPFLQYLKEHQILMAVASSNSRELIEATLKSHGIDSYFSAIVTACEVCAGKPAPDVYLEAARRLGVEPESCLVFEDIVMGIQAGAAAGMTTCAVKDDYSIPQDQEKRAIADYYIESYEQVMDHTYEEL